MSVGVLVGPLSSLQLGKLLPLATVVSTLFRKVSKSGGQSQSIDLLSKPAHQGVPSLRRMPCVTPKGGIRSGSTPEEEEEVAASEAIVMKVAIV